MKEKYIRVSKASVMPKKLHKAIIKKSRSRNIF